MRSLLKKLTSGTKAPAQPASGFVERPLAPRERRLLGRTIGCFLTDDRLFLAAARHLGHRRTVTAVAIKPLPPDVSPDERTAFIATESAAFYDRLGGRGARITVCVAGNGTAFRTFLLPNMNRRDLAAAVQIEAARQVPFPTADCHYGYRPTAKLTGDGQSRCKIALHAATRKLLRGSLAPLEKAEIPVHAVHSGPAAVGQLLTALPEFNPKGTYILLRIGLHDSETAFYRGGVLEFFHHGGSGASMLGDNPDDAHLEFFAETLATEIQTSFDYYAGQHARQTAPEILVYGAAAGHPRLLALLSERVGHRFTPFPIDRLRGLKLLRGLDRDNSLAALPAIAAALCRADLVNLLPPERQTYWRLRRIDSIGRAAVAAALILLAVTWGWLNRDLHIHEESSLALQRQLAMYENSEAYHALNTLKGRLAAAGAYMKQSEKDPTYLALNLKELSHLTPPEIRLTRFDLTTAEPQTNLRLQGLVESSAVPPEVLLAEFVERLNASTFYDNVAVERHVKRRINDRFELDFQLALRGYL